MLKLFTGASVFISGKIFFQDFIIDHSKNFYFYNPDKHSDIKFDQVIDCSGLHVFPGFIDPHVHLREPGFEYKDNIKNSTTSASAGGYTCVFSMPNLNPAPDSIENVQVQKYLIKKNAVIKVIPVCSITKNSKGTGELADLKNLCKENKFFSDDGKGVQDTETMKKAMQELKLNDAIILAHCEDETELKGGSLNEGPVSQKFNDAGINNASEYNQVIRDIDLSKETGCKYHVCHISTKESVDYLKANKSDNISAEVTVHHALLNENDIDCDNGKWKMNPPLRSESDHKALIKGIQDGTIEMFCTDNAPHDKSEKDCAIKDAAMGIVSIEAAFPLIYTKMVKTNQITLEQAVKMFSENVAKFFHINCGAIKEGSPADICIFDLNQQWKIDSNKFKSKGKSCPFDGQEVYGKCKMTICDGEIVYKDTEWGA